MERANDVARQIEVLLLGLARRADGSGLTALAGRLREVALEASRDGSRQAGDAPDRTRLPDEPRAPQNE